MQRVSQAVKMWLHVFEAWSKRCDKCTDQGEGYVDKEMKSIFVSFAVRQKISHSKSCSTTTRMYTLLTGNVEVLEEHRSIFRTMFSELARFIVLGCAIAVQACTTTVHVNI